MFTKDKLFLSCLVACRELTVESNILSELFSQCESHYVIDIILDTFAQQLWILGLKEKFQFSISRHHCDGADDMV